MNIPFYIQLSFILLSIFCLACILLGLRKVLPKTGLHPSKQKQIFRGSLAALLLWSGFLSFYSLSGLSSNFSAIPPRMLLVLPVPLIAMIILSFSKNLKIILQHTPAQWLIQIQIFRVAVEVLLWMLFSVQLLPEIMTFEGTNWDILAGITAPVIAYICFAGGRKRYQIALVWNILSLLLLINIVGTAVMALPGPLQQFTTRPDNTVVASFPIIFLPGILVPIAYYFHFFSIRQLLATRRQRLQQADMIMKS